MRGIRIAFVIVARVRVSRVVIIVRYAHVWREISKRVGDRTEDEGREGSENTLEKGLQ